MATVSEQPASVPTASAAAATDPTPAFPDYMLDPNAVTKDDVTWRNGQPPNYSKTRNVYAEERKGTHTPGSLESLVENLVKNWEIEASHKIKVSDWRTVDHTQYTFAINGGAPQDAEHMLKVGTYNAIIAPNQYYDPATSDFEKSHKTFRDMMPTFAWEVLEVYSGPPTVAFKWRHWGEMRQDYVGWNDKGEKITIRGHGGALDIKGVTVAKLNSTLQVKSLETWFDPVEMFNQMKPMKPTDVEVEVNGHKLDDNETAKLLEDKQIGNGGMQDLAEKIIGNGQQDHNKEFGSTDATTDKINGATDFSSAAEQIEGAELTDKGHTHILNHSVAAAGDHEHSEIREHKNGDAKGQHQPAAAKNHEVQGPANRESEDQTPSVAQSSSGTASGCPFIASQNL